MPLGDGDRTIALPHFNALMILLAGVAAGLVEGTTAPMTPIGASDLGDACCRVVADHAAGLCIGDITKQAQCFAMVLGDLVRHVAKAGGLHGQFCQRAVTVRLHDGPASRRCGTVIALLGGPGLIGLFEQSGLGPLPDRQW